MSGSSQIIRSLLECLEYEREAGVRTIELAPETAALLRAARKRPAPVRPAAEPAPAKAPELKISGQTLEEIAAQISACTACPLCKTRQNTVAGEGNVKQPDVLFVGEGPGADEDVQGRPFVGAAGKLLDKMIGAMGYQRAEVFIANVVKCRPPGNRVPRPEEMQACLPYLQAQIRLIRPKMIVALGKTAVEGLLGEPVAITRMRGAWSEYEGIPMMPTYHPAFLLRSPGRKAEAWADLKAVLERLGKKPPPRGGGES